MPPAGYNHYVADFQFIVIVNVGVVSILPCGQFFVAAISSILRFVAMGEQQPRLRF